MALFHLLPHSLSPQARISPFQTEFYQLNHPPLWSFLQSFDTPTRHSITIGAEYKFQKFSTKASPNGVLEIKGVPTSVPVRVAHELSLAGYRYLDVRTGQEFNAGHAPGAINIPYWHKYGDGTTKNTEFVAQVSSQFGKDDGIIVGCKSGRRSMMAATDLLAAGFSAVKDVAGGYDDWIQNELPTEL